MQGTLVQSLVWENFTYWGATKPVYYNYWAPESRACVPEQEKPLQIEACTSQGKGAAPPAQSPPKAWAAPKTSAEKKKQKPKTHTERNKNVSRLLLFFNDPFYFILPAA